MFPFCNKTIAGRKRCNPLNIGIFFAKLVLITFNGQPVSSIPSCVKLRRIPFAIVDDIFFTITFFDTGQPFTPDAVAQPSLPASDTNLENLQVGGLGLSMIRKMMDEVIFQFENAGNTLLLKKRLPTKLTIDS